jgi:hypothetical protein
VIVAVVTACNNFNKESQFRKLNAKTYRWGDDYYYLLLILLPTTITIIYYYYYYNLYLISHISYS